MPYYSWSGIDLTGKILTGKQFARSTLDLDKHLFNQEIALLNAKESKIINLKLLISKPTKKSINQIINHISLLLKAGLTIHQALEVICKNTKNEFLKVILKDILRYIYEGQTLSEALNFHKDLFDLLTRSVIYSGEKSSNLSDAFIELANHNIIIENFKKKVKAALFMPIITLLLFIAISLGIFIFVIPKFEIFFNTIDENKISKSTRFILYISKLVNSQKPLYFIIILSIILIFTKLFKLNLWNYIQQKILFKMPIISDFLFLTYQAKFLQKLNLLLKAGTHITNALEIITNSSENLNETIELEIILKQIKAGKNLSYALSESKILNTYELIALIEVGESSGNLIISIEQASAIYQNKVYTTLNKASFLIQPIILIILGSLISSLILAIYIPIFTLSSVIK